MKKHKLVMIGASGAGKTSIVSRLLYSGFDPNYRGTIGIDFMSHVVAVDGKQVPLQIWDTAGQERFASLIPTYVRGSRCAVIVYDVTVATAEADIRAWHKIVMREGNEPYVVLVGNKIDRDDIRQIASERGRKMAEAMGAMYIETSAKTGHNIEEMFRRIARVLMTEKGPEPPAMFEGMVNVDLNDDHGVDDAGKIACSC